MIDLRSDTVTKPTDGMRSAMAEARVGDDVFGEDPTVLTLQERIADLLGHDAGLFVPSGTMCNQIALKVHTEPGDEIICEEDCHIVNYETGAIGALSGANVRTLRGAGGIISADQITQAVRKGYYWEPRSRVLSLENTHNKAGGTIWPLDIMTGAVQAAREHGLTCHLDGARLWNASVASGVALREYASLFDTVSVCLSKGLGTPAGSVLVGSKDLIQKAHRYRKMFGGGMRQVGILAAAGLYALDHHVARLADDHANATRLATGLSRMNRVRVRIDAVQTNIVMFDVEGGDAIDIVDQCRQHGVAIVPFGPRTIRATTHLDVTTSDIDDALQRVTPVLDT